MRVRNRLRIALSLVAGVLVLAGCGTESATGNPSPAGAPSASASAKPRTAGPCANPWYPVVKDATWTLKSETPAFTAVSTITEVTETSFTVQGTTGGIVATQSWRCTAEGLLNASGPLTTTVGSITGKSTLISTTGVTFPPNPQPGDTWTDIAKYQTEVIGVVATDTTTTIHKAIGIEQVSVPAGKFECLHTDAEVTIRPDDGSDPTVFHIQAWYGRNVGLVKMTTNFAGANGELVLTAYKIP